MLRVAGVSFLTGVSVALALVFTFLTVVAESSINKFDLTCSRTCVAKNCDSKPHPDPSTTLNAGIRYGKYCGVGWTGCPGENPCDDVDACCKHHDECVGKHGLANVKCHEKFKSCIKRVQKSGKVGFSQECPYETAVPTMVQGMDLAILMSQLTNGKFEL